MKQLILVTSLFISTLSFSQLDSKFGIKAGLNYNANGNYFESVGSNAQNPDRNIGYHLGLFGKFGNNIYFRPELVFTNTKSDYDSADFNMKKLDAPLLVGIKVLGPITVFGGPSIQYILDTDFENINISNIDNDITFGLNFGIGLNFSKVGLDLRYERGFSNNEATFLQNNGIGISQLDTRPDQLILSVSLSL